MIPSSHINPEVGGTGFPHIALPTFAKIAPKGPVIKLSMVLNQILVDMGDETKPDTEGAIYTGQQQVDFSLSKIVKVLSVGPDVKTVKEGDSVLVKRVQVNQSVYDGNSYWITQEPSVIGIVRQ